MVRIRLMRVGKRKQPSYRVVVADARSPRDGRIIEALGHYAPRREPSEISIDTDRAVYWLQQGAQPSNQVRKLLQLSGAWSAFTGEAAPEMKTPPAKPTPAASIKATPAASVDEEPAELPEAEDQQAAAPDAEPQEDK
ncbi:MAG: 30S ribosomal protein S16 [Actinomycetota bacterium]|nr:30S ribosomal protein S16 [Actinomycetota bacterium]